MAITLTYLGVTTPLSDRLDWTDEYAWSPVEQSAEYSLTGALLLQVGAKLAGRPITLVGTETAAWLPRSVCDTLYAWAAVPSAEFDLVLRGLTHRVAFDHARGGFQARPVVRLLDGEIDGLTLYLPTFNFIGI